VPSQRGKSLILSQRYIEERGFGGNIAWKERRNNVLLTKEELMAKKMVKEQQLDVLLPCSITRSPLTAKVRA